MCVALGNQPAALGLYQVRGTLPVTLAQRLKSIAGAHPPGASDVRSIEL